MFAQNIWRWGCAFLGAAAYFLRSVFTDPYALVDLAGTLGKTTAGAFFGLILGMVLGGLFGRKTPPPKI